MLTDRLRMSFAVVAAANVATALWHLYVVHMLRSAMNAGPLIILASFITGVCAIAIVLSWTGHRKTAGWLLVGYAVLGSTTGGYTHFVAPGPENVFQISPGEWVRPYQISATLLLLLQLLALGLGVGMTRACGVIRPRQRSL